MFLVFMMPWEGLKVIIKRACQDNCWVLTWGGKPCAGSAWPRGTSCPSWTSHSEGAKVKDGKRILELTPSFILNLFPDIPEKIVKLFVKFMYHARIKALNENDILVRVEELRRKAQEQKEAPKKQKTVRDFSKDWVIKIFIFLQYLFPLKFFLTLCQFPTFKWTILKDAHFSASR